MQPAAGAGTWGWDSLVDVPLGAMNVVFRVTVTDTFFGGTSTCQTTFDVDNTPTCMVIAPLGGSVSWQNPDTGASGRITPIRDGTSAAGHYCRQFEDSRTVGGLPQTAILVACQQPDGSWYAVN